MLQFVCDDADGPNSDDCLYNQCDACLQPLWGENCVGDHYPIECCNSLLHHANCLSDRALTCGTSLTDGFVALGLLETADHYCADGCPIDWDGCDNELLCACFADYKTNTFDCKYNDDTCLCPFEEEFIDCTQAEVERCGNDNAELKKVHAKRIKQRDDICARAGDGVPLSGHVPPTFCSEDEGGPDPTDCLHNQCIPCYHPLTYTLCSGDHYPAECCDVFGRYISCLSDRVLTCGTGRNDGALVSAFTNTFEGFCTDDGCPIHWEGCNNDLFCSCFSEYQYGAANCMYSDDTCRCPLETAFVACTQPEVDRCGTGNVELNEVAARRIQQRDEICARAAE